MIYNGDGDLDQELYGRYVIYCVIITVIIFKLLS